MNKQKIQQKPDDDGDNNSNNNYNDVDNDTSKSGVNDDNDESAEETDERAKLCANELNSVIEDTENLDGPYWSNGTLGSKTDLYMLSAITTYNNIDSLYSLRATPQYEFNRGMKDFGQA